MSGNYQILEWNHDKLQYDKVLEDNLSWEEANDRLREIRSRDNVGRGVATPSRTIVPMNEMVSTLQPEQVLLAEAGVPMIEIPTDPSE